VDVLTATATALSIGVPIPHDMTEDVAWFPKYLGGAANTHRIAGTCNRKESSVSISLIEVML
jgi:hypothetical protein